MKCIFDRYNLLDVLLPFLFIVSFFLMPYLDNCVHSSVWKDYRILFTPLEHNQQLIQDENIRGLIDKTSINSRFQKIEENSYPFTLKELYSQWFENEQDGLSYVYIPKKSYIPFSFLKKLKNNNIRFYLEGEPHLHYVNLISTLILFIFFFLFSNRRGLFFFTSLPFLLLSFLVTSFLMFYATTLFLLSTLHLIEIFFAPNYLNQEQRKKKIKKNSIIFIIPFFAIILVIFDTYLSYIYVLLSIISSLSIGYTIEKFSYLSEREKDAYRTHEKPIFYAMHPYFIERIWSIKKAILIFIIFSLSFIPHVIFHLFYTNPLQKKYTNTLCFPMPSCNNKKNNFDFSSYLECLENKAGDALPDLTNYVLDTWFYNVYPYIDVRKKITFPQEDESIIFRDFYNAGGGVIKEKEPVIFTFNNAFIKKTLNSIPANSIEEMLQKEEGFVFAFYNFKFFPITRFNVLTIPLSVLFIFLSWIIIFLSLKTSEGF